MRLINNIAIFAAMALSTPLMTIAQNSTDTVYTLQQCKTLALANNADIRMAENNLQAAIETRKEAFTKYFPEISAGASAFKTHNPVIQFEVLDLFTIGIINKERQPVYGLCSRCLWEDRSSTATSLPRLAKRWHVYAKSRVPIWCSSRQKRYIGN